MVGMQMGNEGMDGWSWSAGRRRSGCLLGRMCTHSHIITLGHRTRFLGGAVLGGQTVINPKENRSCFSHWETRPGLVDGAPVKDVALFLAHSLTQGKLSVRRGEKAAHCTDDDGDGGFERAKCQSRESDADGRPLDSRPPRR